MLKMPQRSVTRFFIPLIDVLTLLFCIFLVMPLATDAREANKTAAEKAAEGRNRHARRQGGADRMVGVAEAARDDLERRRADVPMIDIAFRGIYGDY